tara:strand:+ start:287 stop:613 length:327 start_codon:yes stop_codon:yes gene_type:complete
MKNEKNYKPLPPYLAIGPSSIHGAGIFATEDIPKGVIMGISHIYDPNFEHDFIRTPLGGFINHSETPNCELIEEDGDYHYKKVRTLKTIKEGKEVTLKYSLYKFNINE